MSKRLATPRRDIYLNAVRIVSLDCSGVLDQGETVLNTSTATDSSGELTIEQVAPSTTDLTINGVTVATGKALQFKVTRGSAPAARYEIDVVLKTSAGQTIPCAVVLNAK